MTPRLVPSGTNWNQEFCYRGPPRTKCDSVSECRNDPPLAIPFLERESKKNTIIS